ncbi:MAG: cellulase family glycosylhydrolase [Lachnospiraceae bacterium]|nr:cellulase family glycosylhydrolase [Lachnospiraceae bacterium]
MRQRKNGISSVMLQCLLLVICVVGIHTGVSAKGVADYGALKVSGTQLVSQKTGEQVVLRGVSTHGINWDVGYPYVSREAFQTLRDQYAVNAIRLAMYTTEYYGYCDKAGASDSQSTVQATLKKRIDTGVTAATELGMYVIIDWHVLNDQNPNKYKDQAKAFFKEMSAQYANYDNVIYEICNEPNGGTTWSDIRSYAEIIIPVIRANDPDAIVIVGTPTWSQDVDVAAGKPLSYDNVLYALHFYSATHKDSYREKLKTAVAKGLPVIVSEFGVSEASGAGNIDTAEAKKWLDVLDQNGISYFAWSLSNKPESASLLKAGMSKKSGWSKNDLSPAGKWILSQYPLRSGQWQSQNPGGLAKVKNLRVKTKGAKRIKIQFAAVSGADGYQILYGTSKSFAKAKKKIVYKKSTIIPGLKRGKTYYVKVRAFKKQDGSRSYGAFSKAKKMKVK